MRFIMLRLATLIMGLFALSCAPALSETYYVAPLGAVVSGTPDGTESKPFLSLEAAFASGKVKGGDTLLLKDGAYGAVTIKANAAFDVPVEIASQNGKAAQMDSILLAETTRNLIFRNLSVWPKDPATGEAYLIRSYNMTSNITLDGLDIRSELDSGNYMQWDSAKWEARKFSGILLEGPQSLVIRSRLTGIRHGIMVLNDSKIIDNVIDGYNGDGLRAFSRSTVRGNRVFNCVQTDGNHADGFQSYSLDGVPVTDLVMENNIIIEWIGAADHPLRCSLQGVGLFDGPYDNLTIINNLVSATQYHGISVYGARGAKIINNTVVNSLGLVGKYPYIAVHPRKDGTPTTDVLVANNIAMSIQGIASDVDRIVFRNNSLVGIPSQVFENLAVFDYRPKASSGLVDTGDATVAPPTDVMGQKRPSGPLPDRGAYEVQGETTLAPEPVVPVEGIAPPPDTTTDGSTSTGGTTTEPVVPVEDPALPTDTITEGSTSTGGTTTEPVVPVEDPALPTDTITEGSTSTGGTTTTTTSPGGAKSIRIKLGGSKKTSSLDPLTGQSSSTKRIELK
jgi:parallel beta-helix repeat protein